MVRVRGSKVGIVGGSIAGCATAIALGRLGCDVHIFERSSGALRDRGSGILLPPPSGMNSSRRNTCPRPSPRAR